ASPDLQSARARADLPAQWLIIQGRALGKLLAPPGNFAVFDFCLRRLGPQQEQLVPWVDESLGSCAARSLIAKALRRLLSMPASAGATTKARAAGTPQSGHPSGSALSAIGRRAVKIPHVRH